MKYFEHSLSYFQSAGFLLENFLQISQQYFVWQRCTNRDSLVTWASKFCTVVHIMFGIMDTSSHASNKKCLITIRFTGHSPTVGPQFVICCMSHFSRQELEMTTTFMRDLWTPTVTGSYSMKRPQTFKEKASLYRKI